jgi:hypothetical protein
MNLLENLDQLCEPELSSELIALRNQWEKQEGGWITAVREEVNAEMLKNPDMNHWKAFIDGAAWTADVPGKLDKLYDLLATEGLIDKDIANTSKALKTKLSPAGQVREGKTLSAWLRDHREWKKEIAA